MTNLVKCAGCGKEFSGKVPKCPKCGAKYCECLLCYVPISPNERMHIVGEETKYIHLSCLEPYFISPEHVKCPDCGQRINCPSFSLEDFIEKDYTKQKKEMLTVNCLNCGNPDVLDIYMLKSKEFRDFVESTTECHYCGLLIIPAIHNIEAVASDATVCFEHSIHSFCSYKARDWRHKRKKGGWFNSFFGEPDPGRNKNI